MDQIYAYIQKQLAICEPGDSQLQILRQMKISNDEKIKYYLSMQGWSGAIQPKGLEFLKLCEQFGCYIFPAARTFWEQFGGLSIHSRFHFDSTEFEGLFIGNDSFDIDDVIELELLELKKNELLIPVGVDTLWGTYNGYRTVYWGESGKVYVTNEGFIYTIAQDMFSYLAQVIGLENIQFVWECENENYEDYDLCDQLEEELNNHTYVSYVQKRFMENRGVPNPIIAKDTFTQWILSMKC